MLSSIKLKRNKPLIIHKFEPYIKITNVHDFGQIISTSIIFMNGWNCDFIHMIYFFAIFKIKYI